MATSTELPKAVFDKMMEHDHYSHWLGIEPVVLDEGHTVLKMTVRKEMLNGFKILHGGVAFAFADSCFAFAANSFGRTSVTINANIVFSDVAKEGEVLIAEATALDVSYKTAAFDVNIYEEESKKIYYRFRGTAYRSSKEMV